MSKEPNCPKCQSQYTYADGSLWICPDCAHEWSQNETSAKGDQDSEQDKNSNIIKDAFGVVLENGDAVSIIKDLKVKGASAGIKVGTKIKNIKLVESDDGHNIACRIEGIGALNVKSEFVKKVN
jgi:protein PhnA